MISSLGVEGNDTGTGLGKILNHLIDGRDHQMHVDGGGDAIVPKGLTDHRADGEIGHIVVIHDVKMNDIGACSQYSIDLFA